MALSVLKSLKGLILNEKNDRRAALLDSIDFGVPTKLFFEDATHINDILPKEEVPTVVLMNPPFSATAGRMEGTRTNKVGMVHVEQALKRLKKGGRLVALVGQGLANDKPGSNDFWEKIKKSYTVRANIGLSGKSYRKFGTSFDNQLLVIDKIGPHKGDILTDSFKDKDALGNLKNALRLLEGVRNERISKRKRAANTSTGEKVPGERPSESDGAVPSSTSGGSAGDGLSAGGSGPIRGGAGDHGETSSDGSGTGVRRRRLTREGGEGVQRPGRSEDSGNAGDARPDNLADIVEEFSKDGVTGIAEDVKALLEIFGDPKCP